MANDALIRGDDYSFQWTLVNADNTPFDLSGSTLWYAAVPTTTGSDDATAYFSQAIVFNPDGTVAVSEQYDETGTVQTGEGTPLMLPVGHVAADGLLTQTISHTTTNTMGAVNYKWEIQLKDAAGKFHTLLSGIGTVAADIVRRVTVP